MENAAYKRAGEDGAEQGEESTPTWNAVAAGCLPRGSGGFSGPDFLDQVENEKRIKRTTHALPMPCSITGQSQCSQHTPWLFAINKL